MLVVADRSPINIMVRIGCVDVLPKLFASVLIPPEVFQELSNPATPEPVRALTANLPSWLFVRTPDTIERIPPLNRGEEAAIALARDTNADAILIDDLDARRAAVQRGIAIIGTLGVLEQAAAVNLIQLPDAAARLAVTDFRIAPRLVQEALARDSSRRQNPRGPA